MSNEIVVISPGTPIEGVGQDVWGDRWWQWNLPIPEEKDPSNFDDNSDPRGRLGSIEKGQEAQDDDVFYLVGAFSTGNPLDIPNRTIIVPDKEVFFPVVNVSWSWGFDNGFFENLAGYPNAEGPLTPDEIRTINTAIIDAVEEPYVTLDGENPYMGGFPEDFRQVSPPDSDGDGIPGFTYVKDGNEIAEVGEGYWTALEPLPPGDHTIQFGGKFVLGDIKIDLDGNGSVDEGKEEFVTGVLQGFGTLPLDVTYNVLNQILGTKGKDDLSPSESDSNDYIFGGNGKDTITGLGGNDVILGGNGKDVLDGGSGKDELWGGNGKDLFIFKAGYGTDAIFDFKPGKDSIDISGLTVDLIEEIDYPLDSGVSGTKITFNETGDELILVGVQPNEIDNGVIS